MHGIDNLCIYFYSENPKGQVNGVVTHIESDPLNSGYLIYAAGFHINTTNLTATKMIARSHTNKMTFTSIDKDRLIYSDTGDNRLYLLYRMGQQNVSRLNYLSECFGCDLDNSGALSTMAASGDHLVLAFNNNVMFAELHNDTILLQKVIQQQNIHRLIYDSNNKLFYGTSSKSLYALNETGITLIGDYHSLRDITLFGGDGLCLLSSNGRLLYVTTKGADIKKRMVDSDKMLGIRPSAVHSSDSQWIYVGGNGIIQRLAVVGRGDNISSASGETVTYVMSTNSTTDELVNNDKATTISGMELTIINTVW